MGLCQDCGENDATNIIFDKDKNMSFLVCGDCIKEVDILINHSIKNIIEYMEE